MNYLFDGMITVHGHEIYCKVSGDQNTIGDFRSYTLLISDLGFSHVAAEQWAVELDTRTRRIGTKRPSHFILFDALGCGKSASSKNPNEEYTIEFYAEMAARLVEVLKEKLFLQVIDLRIIGDAFGGMVALTIPKIRPNWLTDRSNISLNQLFTIATPISHKATTNAKRFIESRYQNESDYVQLIEATDKTFHGHLANRDDYLQHVPLTLGKLYSEKNERLQTGLLGQLTAKKPALAITLLRLLRDTTATLPLLTHTSLTLSTLHDSLTGISLDVFNHFFTHRLDGFCAKGMINSNPSIYKAVPSITLIAGVNDYLAEPALNADIIHAILPDNCSTIALNARHDIGADQPILYDILAKSLYGVMDQPLLYHYELAGVLTKSVLATNFQASCAKIQTLERHLFHAQTTSSPRFFLSACNFDIEAQDPQLSAHLTARRRSLGDT